MAAAVFCLALAMGMTGCVKTTEKREAEEENATQESEWEKEEPVTAKEAKPEPDKEEQADNVEKPEPDKEEQADNRPPRRIYWTKQRVRSFLAARCRTRRRMA